MQADLAMFSVVADAFFKAAISLVPEVPRHMDIDGKTKSTEPLLIDFINNFVSTLLLVPVRGFSQLQSSAAITRFMGSKKSIAL